MAKANPVSATAEEQVLAPAAVVLAEPVKEVTKETPLKATPEELAEAVKTVPEGKDYSVVGNAIIVNN